jgi:hypothetical protein
MADRTSELQENRPELPDVLLWLAALAGPLAWAATEMLGYALAPTACWSGRQFFLHLIPVATLLIAAAGAALARLRWRAEPSGSTETGDTRQSRRRFMALFGFWACLGFAVAILAQEVPNLVLRVCD